MPLAREPVAASRGLRSVPTRALARCAGHSVTAKSAMVRRSGQSARSCRRAWSRLAGSIPRSKIRSRPRSIGCSPEPAFVERQKAKCRDMSFVKDERVAQRNGAIVECCVIDEREDRRRLRTIAPIPIHQVGAIERGPGNYSVPRFSCSRSIETKSALKLPLPNDRLPLR